MEGSKWAGARRDELWRDGAKPKLGEYGTAACGLGARLRLSGP